MRDMIFRCVCVCVCVFVCVCGIGMWVLVCQRNRRKGVVGNTGNACFAKRVEF